MNPNMKGEKLKGVFESLGFKNVQTVIASGNVVFDLPRQQAGSLKSTAALEKKIEAALPKQLGFTSTTIIRSQQELEKLVKKNPFKGVKDEKPNYLLVTFFKDRTKKELCTVIKLTEGKTPDFMSKVEREHGKAITSRTWKTVHRILAKMEK
jgi:uncharacterized protein (DUF1697 family)